MKRYLSIVIFICLNYCQVTAQKVIIDITKRYYRSNPFENEFNRFLNHLMNDPTLGNTIINKKTDSTLFYLEGIYSSHNPFFFKAAKTKIILAEREDVETEDTSQYLQTTFLYQIVAYAPPGEEGIKDVQNEFDKFNHRYKNKFEGDNYKELKNEEKHIGELIDFSSGYPGFFPVTIAWTASGKSTDTIFALTIRFRVMDNLAYLPLLSINF